jgi:DNA-binding transcriptional ArsR family regulator
MAAKVRLLTNSILEPAVEVQSSEWVECLTGISFFIRTDVKCQSLEVGCEWFDKVRTMASTGLIEMLAPFRSVPHVAKFWFALTAAMVDGPASVPDAVRRLEETPAEEVWTQLLGLHSRHDPPPGLRAALLAAGRGETGALASQVDPGNLKWVGEVVRMFGADAERAKATVLETVRRWYSEVFEAQWAELGPIIERDADATRQLASEQPVGELYERATRGGEYVQEVGIDRLLMVPTYLGRPWVLQGRQRSTLLVCYPVSEETLAPSVEEARLGRILRISKAIGDESRLRTLRRLAESPSSLQELADHFGVPKSSMHHHIAALRAAGLLRLRIADKRYAPRPEALNELATLLGDYIGLRPRRRVWLTSA